MSPNIAYMRYAIFKAFQNGCQVINAKITKKLLIKLNYIVDELEVFCHTDQESYITICGKMKKPPRHPLKFSLKTQIVKLI